MIHKNDIYIYSCADEKVTLSEISRSKGAMFYWKLMRYLKEKTLGIMLKCQRKKILTKLQDKLTVD